MEDGLNYIKKENNHEEYCKEDKILCSSWVKEEKEDVNFEGEKHNSRKSWYKYSCHHCGNQHNSLRLLKRHIKSLHLSRNRNKIEIKEETVHNYECPNCDFKSTVFSELETHMLLEIRRICHSCNYISTDEADLLAHKCEVVKINFECPLFELSSLPSGDPGIIHQCKFCNYATSEVSALQNHLRARHGEKRPYPCPYCPRSYSYTSSLKIHINSRHERKKDWICPYCGTRLTRSHTLKDHIRAVHFQERPYACPHCDYCAPISSYLKAHIKGKHTTEKPYQCPHCPYRSVRSNTLRSHIRTRHTNDKPHKCPDCSFSCLRPSFLHQHILSKHSNERPHACQYCNYATVRSANLRSHMKVHLKAGIKT